MACSRPRMLVLVSLAIVAGGAGQTLAAQSGGAPTEEAGTPAGRFARHPYTSALGALANYQSCGVHARAAEIAALTAALQASLAGARGKGLGPMLDRLERDYQALLAVSDMTACARGPAASLAGARRAIADFRQWVTDQPPG